MKKRIVILTSAILMICLVLSGCSFIAPQLELSDITIEYGKTHELPTEASGLTGAQPVEYSFSGKNISIENGILKALVAETVTEVTAKCGLAEVTFKVTVTLAKDVENDNTDNDNTDDKEDDGGQTVDKGTMTVKAPTSIYSNYAGKDVTVTFSNPDYASEVTFTTDNPLVQVKDGKISATGKFDSEVTVKVTARSAHHEQTFTVKVSSYQGSVHAEDAVLQYEQSIIKPENQGGMIFVGDSYFSGQLKDGKPSFWSDFYEDYADEKAFLLGISSSQIHDLEIVSERLVYPMNPAEIVVHIGFNDVHHGLLTVEALYARITALMEQYHEKLPEAKIYFIGVEPKKNGYTKDDPYYISSTVKAPALTDMIKLYANGKDWFTYVDTMSVFVDASGNVKKDSYLSTDLSHPTLAAYDEIREILNGVRAAANEPSVPDSGDTPPVDPDNPGGNPPVDPDEPGENPPVDPDEPGENPPVDPDEPGENPPVDPDEPIDYGTMTVNGPSSIYSNYPGKEITVTFSKPEYATTVTFTTDNPNVTVKDGKIAATGVYSSAFNVTVTATAENFETKTFTVSVSTFTGGVNAETKVQYYEQNIIKPENKGGIILVGDSYFDGVPNGTGSPSFWADFYYDYQNEKAFLMGISSSQIDDLETVSERIVYPMEPKEIVVHIGFNDVHHGPLSVDELYSRIIALCEQYRARLGDVKVYFIGVEPKKNGYQSGTAYYTSSTEKAPALTEKIKNYAESSSWFTYVDTLSIFTDGTTIDSDAYLHCDLSHPSLHAYDAIRAAINSARGVENFAAEDAVYVNEYGVGTTIDSTGKTYTAANGSALTNNYIISGKLTIADINKKNAHLQFRFSSKYRFLLWDSNSDAGLGVGYSANGVNKNDTTTGAVIYNAKDTRFNLDWAIVVDNGKASLYLNGALMETMDAPVLEYFRIGASQMDVQFYDITLTVKSEDATAYAERLEEYKAMGDPDTEDPNPGESADPTKIVINSYGVNTDINGSGRDLTDSTGSNNYVVSGKLNITRINKSNAHLQFRFSQGYRFLLWDESNDGVLGAGYIATGLPNKNDKTSGATLFDANNGLTLEWAVVVNDGKAYWYINGDLMATFESPTLSYFNIGALQMDVTISEITVTTKAANATAYAQLLSEYGIN